MQTMAMSATVALATRVLVALSKSFLTARLASSSRPSSAVGDLPALTIATADCAWGERDHALRRRPRSTRNVCQRPAGELLGARTWGHSQGRAHTLVLSVTTYVAFPRQRRRKSGAIAGTCQQVPQARPICGSNFCLTRLFFSPHSLINQPAISSRGAPSNPTAMKSVRNAKRLRARGMSCAIACAAAEFPCQRQRESL